MCTAHERRSKLVSEWDPESEEEVFLEKYGFVSVKVAMLNHGLIFNDIPNRVLWF